MTAPLTLNDQLRALLAGAPGGLNTAELREALAARYQRTVKRSVIGSRLYHLCERGIASPCGGGRYCIAAGEHPPARRRPPAGLKRAKAAPSPTAAQALRAGIDFFLRQPAPRAPED